MFVQGLYLSEISFMMYDSTGALVISGDGSFSTLDITDAAAVTTSYSDGDVIFSGQSMGTPADSDDNDASVQ